MKDWLKYVVFDSSWADSEFNLSTINAMDAYDPGNVSTFDVDFTSFKAKGGKIISYHGRADPVRQPSFNIFIPKTG